MSPEHRTRSAALAAMFPAVPTLGTKIVKDAVSVQPDALVTITVTVDCWVIEFVVRTLSVTSARGAGAPLIVKA